MPRGHSPPQKIGRQAQTKIVKLKYRHKNHVARLTGAPPRSSPPTQRPSRTDFTAKANRSHASGPGTGKRRPAGTPPPRRRPPGARPLAATTRHLRPRVGLTSPCKSFSGALLPLTARCWLSDRAPGPRPGSAPPRAGPSLRPKFSVPNPSVPNPSVPNPPSQIPRPKPPVPRPPSQDPRPKTPVPRPPSEILPSQSLPSQNPPSQILPFQILPSRTPPMGPCQPYDFILCLAP